MPKTRDLDVTTEKTFVGGPSVVHRTCIRRERVGYCQDLAPNTTTAHLFPAQRPIQCREVQEVQKEKSHAATARTIFLFVTPQHYFPSRIILSFEVAHVGSVDR